MDDVFLVGDELGPRLEDGAISFGEPAENEPGQVVYDAILAVESKMFARLGMERPQPLDIAEESADAMRAALAPVVVLDAEGPVRAGAGELFKLTQERPVVVVVDA
jgi:hypothetical protein